MIFLLHFRLFFAIIQKRVVGGGNYLYSFIHGILCDRKGGDIFTCFGLFHICFILFVFAVTAVVCVLIKNKSANVKEKTCNAFISIAFGLYIADFFLMPFAYEEIDIEKLPFHICTAMCVMCFLSRHTRLFGKYRINFALLGFISNLVYLIYPAGVMWHAVHPFTYRVIQTLLFHGIMTAYGFLTIVFNREGLSFKKCHRDLAVLVGMTLWALLGNLLYTGSAGKYSADFNWFFVTQDPFGLIDKNIAVFIMPFLNIAIFFAVEMLIYLIYYAVKRIVPTEKKVEE